MNAELREQQPCDDGRSDSDNDDIDDLPLFYTARPNFDWHTDQVTADADRLRHVRRQYTKRPGPVRVIDGSATARELFQIFYTDVVFEKLTTLTNENAADNDKNKGVWWPVTIEEMKAFYGVTIMTDLQTVD